MRNALVAVLTTVLGLAAAAPADTILVDVGLGNSSTPDAGWNNATSLTAVVPLNYTTGASSGFTATFAGWNGANGQGATAATTPAYPQTAYGDSFYLDAGNTGTVTLTNLDPNLTYTFTVLASRATNATNRVGVYTVTGANNASAEIDAASPSASGNLSALTFATAIVPTAGNTITLSVTPKAGSAFAYLNVLQIETAPVPEPATLALLPAGLSLLFARRARS